MLPLRTFDLETWCPMLTVEQTRHIMKSLEGGNVLYFPHLTFDLENIHEKLLTPTIADKKQEKVIFNLDADTLSGIDIDTGVKDQVYSLMHRFSTYACSLVDTIFPYYKSNLKVGDATLKLSNTPEVSLDQAQLAFEVNAKKPTRGQRIITLYVNVNPKSAPQNWAFGKTFEQVLQLFKSHLTKPKWGARRLMRILGMTTSYRSLYDHYMLMLNKMLLSNQTCQCLDERTTFSFPGQTSWMVLGDQVPHAVLSSGQYVLEHTFYLPSCAQRDPQRSPLYQLQELLQDRLI